MPFFREDGSPFYPRAPGGLMPLQHATLAVLLQAKMGQHSGILTADGRQPTWPDVLDWAIVTDELEEILLGKRGALTARILDKIPGSYAIEALEDRREVLRQRITPAFMLAVLQMINARPGDDQAQVRA